MQKIVREYSREDYLKLIEYLKLDYLAETLYIRDKQRDYDEIKQSVEVLFDIKITQKQIKKHTWIKRYNISEKWDIYLGPAALLFAHNMQPFRDLLLEEENIQGIITLKNNFFEISALPAAVIVFGNSHVEKIWLTSAASSEDIINIFTEISSYQKNVYYTEKLDPKNFMPENYNGEKERLNETLDKYETKPLKDVADIILGKGAGSWELGEKGIPYLRQRDIQKGVVVKADKYVSESDVEKYAKQLLQEGDILLTKNFGQHKIARVSSDNLPAIASNSLFIIRAFGVPDNYLYEYFTSNTGKAILDRQLSSIEQGSFVPSIRKSDLQELKVPIFDEATMLALSQAEDMKVADALSLLNRIRRLGAYAKHLNASRIGSQLEEKIYNDFLNAGWPKENLQMNNCTYAVDLKAGKWFPNIVLLDGKNCVGAVEIKDDFSNIGNDWTSKMREVLKDSKIPCLIFSTGFYYEVHFTHMAIVKKLTEAPSKEMLLSILSGKECDY